MPEHAGEAEQPPEPPAEPTAEQPPAPSPAAPTRPRHRRRVTTDALPGTDLSPTAEPPRHAATENDDRLKADKPPHWG